MIEAYEIFVCLTSYVNSIFLRWLVRIYLGMHHCIKILIKMLFWSPLVQGDPWSYLYLLSFLRGFLKIKKKFRFHFFGSFSIWHKSSECVLSLFQIGSRFIFLMRKLFWSEGGSIQASGLFLSYDFQLLIQSLWHVACQKCDYEITSTPSLVVFKHNKEIKWIPIRSNNCSNTFWNFIIIIEKSRHRIIKKSMAVYLEH